MPQGRQPRPRQPTGGSLSLTLTTGALLNACRQPAAVTGNLVVARTCVCYSHPYSALDDLHWLDRRPSADRWAVERRAEPDAALAMPAARVLGEVHDAAAVCPRRRRSCRCWWLLRGRSCRRSRPPPRVRRRRRCSSAGGGAASAGDGASWPRRLPSSRGVSRVSYLPVDVRCVWAIGSCSCRLQ